MIRTATVLVSFWLSTALCLPECLAQGIAIKPLHLETAGVILVGNDIYITQLRLQNGELVDINITLRPNDGEVVVHQIKTTPSELVLRRGDNFVPGTYLDIAGNKYSLTGGGLIPGGRVSWSLSGTSPVEFDASWMTGSSENHPMVDKKNLPEGFSYGRLGLSNLTRADKKPMFVPGKVVGAVQTAPNTLVIYKFHKDHYGYTEERPSFELQLRRVAN